MSRWFIQFDARSPEDPDNSKWSIGIHEQYFTILRRKGHQAPLARMQLIEEVVLKETKFLVRGWNRPNKENCFVYGGYPNRDLRYIADLHHGGIETPAPKNQSFLVFVLPDGTIDYWNWRPIEKDGLPQSVKGEILWQCPM